MSGMTALRLSLPYHDHRMPPELERADYIVSANVARTVQVCRQAVLDARRAITREMKRAGRVWIRVFPDLPVSKKPAEVRMGSGKGTPELWVARVKPGRVIFEIDGVTVQTAKEALSLAAAKLPIKTRFVARIAE